jgi:hypothetical protein
MRLTETDLLAAAGETVFVRGEDYVQYVRGLRVRGSHATATSRRGASMRSSWIGPAVTWHRRARARTSTRDGSANISSRWGSP